MPYTIAMAEGSAEARKRKATEIMRRIQARHTERRVDPAARSLALQERRLKHPPPVIARGLLSEEDIATIFAFGREHEQ